MPDETVLRAKAREVIRAGKLPPRRTGRPTRRVLPMELQLGDHIMDETGEWEVTGRPFTTGSREECPRTRAEGAPSRVD